jgi:hypothetical protein
MIRLDYLSCLLTVASTVMIGRRLWQGWLVAGANSAVICYIGVRTAQTGFVPANLFCIAMYAYNIAQWRKPASVEEPACATECACEASATCAYEQNCETPAGTRHLRRKHKVRSPERLRSQHASSRTAARER